jgi:adenylosuccinate lyase
MIERYTLPEMGRIWSEENKFRTWLEVELLACEAMVELGQVPREAYETIRRKAGFDIEGIQRIEARVHHDVIAFLTHVAERVGPEARFLHKGMTSSDLLDTALGALLKQAGDLLLARLDRLRGTVKRRAEEHRHTVMVGRTHGVHAEPITFGLKLLLWYEELGRRRETLARAVRLVSCGKISGAVGTYAHVDPRVERYVCERLGLQPASVSSQIVQRDRHAEFLSAVALVGCTLEKIALEVRHLQRTEVLEAEEFFQEGQKGSSAMPHKRNPILAERICGLARLLRTNALAAMENVALWHERDISHSSVERVILPDSTILLDYLLERCDWLVGNLLVYPERMRENLDRTGGLVFSQRVLLALVDSGLTREEAYSVVQEAAMETWRGQGNFRENLEKRPVVVERLGRDGLDRLFDLDELLARVDAIFDRVLSH